MRKTRHGTDALFAAITFRHHQNSSFGKEGQDSNLDSFFKYSQTYSAEDKKGFLPVPKDRQYSAHTPACDTDHC
jgi:hypothetical protein